MSTSIEPTVFWSLRVFLDGVDCEGGNEKGDLRHQPTAMTIASVTSRNFAGSIAKTVLGVPAAAQTVG